MPREIGLGDTLHDQDIDGDIDFDFFDSGQNGPIEERIRSPVIPGKQSPALNKSHGVDAVGIYKTELIKENPFLLSESARPVFEASENHLAKGDCITNGANFVPDCRKNNNTAQGDGSHIRSPEMHERVHSTSAAEISADENGVPSDIDSDIDDDTGDESDNLDVTVTESDSDDDLSSSLSEDSLNYSSDSEITDVTPLSSANISPLPASPKRPLVRRLPLYQRKKENVKFADDKSRRRGSLEAPSSSKQSEAVDLQSLVQAILDMEREHKRKMGRSGESLPSEKPRTSRNRRNMSFTNEDVRRIDKDNQRLLRRILEKRHTQKSATEQQPTKAVPKLPSSAINRIQQQKKIEAENHLLLKRIQSVKPTRELSRSYLLKSQDRKSQSLPPSRPMSQLLSNRSSYSRKSDTTLPNSSHRHTRSLSASSSQCSLCSSTNLPIKARSRVSKASSGDNNKTDPHPRWHT